MFVSQRLTTRSLALPSRAVVGAHDILLVRLHTSVHWCPTGPQQPTISKSNVRLIVEHLADPVKARHAGIPTLQLGTNSPTKNPLPKQSSSTDKAQEQHPSEMSNGTESNFGFGTSSSNPPTLPSAPPHDTEEVFEGFEGSEEEQTENSGFQDGVAELAPS